MNRVEKYSGENLFFTSDTHFNHKNVISYCNRPYQNVDEMNRALIDNWNSVVPENGLVFHLGDFAFGNISGWYSKLLNKLNGRKILIMGNHDKQNKLFAGKTMNGIEAIYDILVINVDGQEIIMCHYPFLTWYNIGRGCWDLFGHFHTNRKFDHILKNIHYLQYDVGVDDNDYKPISFCELNKIMKEKKRIYEEG